MVVPPVQLQQPALPQLGGMPEPGGTSEPEAGSELGETPEPGGLDDSDSGPPTPLPLLGRGIPHRRRVTPPAGCVGYVGKGERGSIGGDTLSAPYTTTAPSGVYSPSVSSEPSADGDLSAVESETSSSGENRPVPTMARTAARQLESNLLRSGVDEAFGRTRAQTRALNQEAAGLVSIFWPDEGGKLILGLLAVQEVTRKPGE